MYIGKINIFDMQYRAIYQYSMKYKQAQKKNSMTQKICNRNE